jgi:hypothetical protein
MIIVILNIHNETGMRCSFKEEGNFHHFYWSHTTIWAICFPSPKTHCHGGKAQKTSTRQPTEWEKIFTSHTSDKGLITKMYRELKKLNSPNINDSMEK